MKRWKTNLLNSRYFGAGAKILLTGLLATIIFTGCDDDEVVTPNSPPPVPSDPIPANEATDQDIGIRLQWFCLDPDEDQLSYYFYLGTINPPPLIDTLNTYLYSHERFEFNTTYYWKVVADDGHNHQVESPVWSFTTGNLYEIDDYDTQNALKIFIDTDNLVYLADDDYGLRIFDVTDTSQLGVRIDSVGALAFQSFNYDVTVHNDIAYVATNEGLRIIDVSNPAAPAMFGTEDDIFDYAEEERAVNVVGNYAYIAAADSMLENNDTTSTMLILDISDPVNVLQVDAFVYTGVAKDIFVDGNYAYIADSLLGLQIFDVSDPANIALETTFATNDAAIGVFVLNNLAYVADGAAGLTIVDVSNPASPSIIGNADTPGFSRDIHVYADHAFIADYWNGGLQIADVSTPSSPVIVTSRNTNGGASGINAANKTINEDDVILVYLGDKHRGLFVYEFQP